MNKETELKIYNNLTEIDKHCNYKYDFVKVDKDYVSNINENYDNMNFEELKNIIPKILSEKQTRSIILDYLLSNYRPIPIKMTLKKFIIEANKVFAKFQSKAGGFYIEDNQWILHDNTSKEHILNENEIIFENSICECDRDNHETNQYMIKIVDYLNNIAENIKVTLTCNDENDDDLIWLLLKCKDTSIDSVEISI